MTEPAIADLARRVAERVDHTDGGYGLENSASFESDRYDGSLISVVEAVVVEIADPSDYGRRFWVEIAKLLERRAMTR